MSIESIGYRYTRDELEALRLVLNLSVPLGIDPVKLDRTRYEAALESLTDSGLVVGTQKQLLIDPILMLMLREASASTHCLRIRSTNRHSVLLRTPQMYLMNDCMLSGCTIKPLQSAKHTKEPVLDALSLHQVPIFIDYLSNEDRYTIEAATPEEALSAALEALRKLHFDPAN